jgi:hypothetical protein
MIDLPWRRASARTPAIPLELALQGGGAHGAFTWGALGRLLDDEGIDIVAISGASAGAGNAVMLTHGLMEASRTGAKRALRQFWKNVSRAAQTARLAAGPVGALRLHRISADETVVALGERGRLNPEWSCLQRLHQQGTEAADQWLARHRADLGCRATLGLAAEGVRRG